MTDPNKAQNVEFEVLPPEESKFAKPFKSLFVILVGAVAALYLLNPGAGFVEILPDNLPVVGNLDEGGATLILLSCFAYFGIDLRPLQAFFKKKGSARAPGTKSSSAKK